ncbi:hypothetical protein [Vibrio sp. 10N.222.55.A1]|uniref:hypothetical protein n=1 Tax=Vibrio sp. 10N.222.55.A1 TaxID=3229646 RepID=UPI00355165D8
MKIQILPILIAKINTMKELQNALYHMSKKLLIESGFTNNQAKKIIYFEVYKLRDQDKKKIQKIIYQDGISVQKAKEHVIRNKQKAHYSSLAEDYYEKFLERYKSALFDLPNLIKIQKKLR